MNRHLPICDLLCSRDLDLDPMTFIYELDPYFLEVYWMCKSYCVRAFESNRLTDRQRQTDTTEIIYHAASQLE